MSDLARWQTIAIDRAVKLELAAMEVEEARSMNDPEKIAIADRYHREAKRMHAAAERRLMELV